MANKPVSDLERVVQATVYGEELPEGFDLVLVLERVRDRNEWEQLGRLTSQYLIKRDIARLRAKQAAILANLPRPPCH